VVKIQFSDNELQNIYEKIVENGLDKFPDKFDLICDIMRFPSFETKFQFKINNKTKIITYGSSCRYYPVLGYFKTRKHKKIDKTLTAIFDIVNKKPTVKELSESDFIFL